MSKRKFSGSLFITTSYCFRLIANIIQVGFFAGSILFLSITTIVVSAGWGKTCATYHNNNIPHRQLFFYQVFDSENFQCAGPRYTRSGYGPYLPNGAEFIAATVSHYEANNNIS